MKKIIVGENDLATTNPKLAAEWDYEANGDLKPTNVTAGSSQKVGWICSKGHKWNAIIANRNNGSGCPYCAGRSKYKSDRSELHKDGSEDLEALKNQVEFFRQFCNSRRQFCNSKEIIVNQCIEDFGSGVNYH